MSNDTLPAPTDGTTPVTLPTQDACCQSPCDPPWTLKPTCTTFSETKTVVLSLSGTPAAVKTTLNRIR